VKADSGELAAGSERDERVPAFVDDGDHVSQGAPHPRKGQHDDDTDNKDRDVP
jgi:hypothetical protein